MTVQFTLVEIIKAIREIQGEPGKELPVCLTTGKIHW
jgi:hypothetical protein